MSLFGGVDSNPSVTKSSVSRMLVFERMNPRFIELLRDKPYVLMVETDRESDAPLAAALGRPPDNYASSRGRIYAAFHYSAFDDMIAGLRKAPCRMRGRPRDIQVSDARVQLARPPVASECEKEIREMKKWALPAPFVVSAGYPCGDFDAIEVTGRAPFVVVGGVAIFTFDNFDDAVAACTRLAVADGTYDDELQNSEIT